MTSSRPIIPQRAQLSRPLQASKWLQIPVLLDVDEMKLLLDSLGQYWLFVVSGPVPLNEGALSQQMFLDCYREYIEAIKNGSLCNDPRIRTYFSSVMTADLNALYAVPIQDTQQLIKPIHPIIQIQGHRFSYTTSDGKFRSMVLSKNSIQWGVQFSYPQLFQDEHCVVHQVLKEMNDHLNTRLFRSLQSWIRSHTVPTPFLVEGKRENVPIRIGKQCFSWIHSHPQLREQGLEVIV